MSLLAPNGPQLVDFLADQRPRLRLIDVGVSGGINPAWRRWGAKLSAIGIDVLVDEIERLTSSEPNANIRYVATRIASREGPAKNLRTNYSLHRSQAYLATVALQRRASGEGAFRALWKEVVEAPGIPVEANYSNVPDPMSDPFFGYYARRNAPDLRLATTTTTLDELVTTPIDVMKIDTDGYELDVLHGAEKLLQSCLAIEVETQFHGLISETSNVFCNIDSFLRAKGFSLYKLSPIHYSRSALPRAFLYDIPAQNAAGQIVWADALYFRQGETTEQCRNLALLFDLYGLEDAAADILLSMPGLFDGVEDRPALDFLARKIHGPEATYKKVIEAFLANPIGFAR